MRDSELNPPATDELEVSIFGPGFGESILLHIGQGKWILVDSCIDPVSKLPAPLKYLSDLNVELDNSVRLIVATHWHKDHIRGLSMLFNACKSADFVMSGALNNDEFYKLISLYKKSAVTTDKPLKEFAQIINILQERKQQGARFGSPKLATMDKLLYRDRLEFAADTVEVSIAALSPSDETILQARLAFARLLPQEDESLKWIAPPSPNHSSVVLWAEVGNHKILLGADLERTNNPTTGWSVILDNSAIISGQGQASLFKVSHHGSENGHHDRVWTDLLVPEPCAILTPYTRGKKPLPSNEDIERITDLTSNAYATAPTKQRQPRLKDNVVRDMVSQATKNIQQTHRNRGQVRLRKGITESSNRWHVALFGDACSLSV